MNVARLFRRTMLIGQKEHEARVAKCQILNAKMSTKYYATVNPRPQILHPTYIKWLTCGLKDTIQIRLAKVPH